MSNRIVYLFWLRFLFFAVLLGLAACQPARPAATPAPEPTPVAPSEVPPELREVWEVWRTLQRDYVEPDSLDAEILARGAIEGMLEALGDPYTAYVDEQQYEIQLQDLSGAFEGIGAVVSRREGRIIIVTPLREGPAEKAGLKAGDMILAIDGESTEGMTVLGAVIRIRGERGTPVRLRVGLPGSNRTREVEIVREVIEMESVTLDNRNGGIIHLAVSTFSSQTKQEVQQALRDVRAQKPGGILLDLRNNPGGLLGTTVRVASEFLPEEAVVLYEVDRTGLETPWLAEADGLALETPLVVLVNGGSASGSEVLAGALQASGRAILVGEPTFGKGSVNILRRLSTGSGLYVTTARWLTPERRSIEGVGLTPDILVENDPETAEDEVLQRGLDELSRLMAA